MNQRDKANVLMKLADLGKKSTDLKLLIDGRSGTMKRQSESGRLSALAHFAPLSTWVPGNRNGISTLISSLAL
jgi:hypothetical protein